MRTLKMFFLFLVCAVLAFYVYTDNKRKDRIAEQEYKKNMALAENYKVTIPELPPKEEMDLPQTVIARLHKSIKSRNAEEAGKAMEILWKVQDGEVLPVMRKYITASRRDSSCYEANCGEFMGRIKEKILEIITRDISQLNFEFLCLALKDRDKSYRLRAIGKISQYYTEDAIEVLDAMVNDKDSEVRTAAMDGVVRIKEGMQKVRQEKIDEVTRKYKYDTRTLKDKISPEAIMKALN